MARISLLFTLAFALALSSLFLSASGHASQISSTPKTVAELQSLPFTEITRILNMKERFAPKTVEFKAMFTMCKGYVTYLESLYKLGHPMVDVLGIGTAKYTLMNKAILVAGASVSGKVDKKAFLKLMKSYAGMTTGFLKIQETIITISAQHNFNSNAKITLSESKNIFDAIIIFKKSISAFMNIIHDVEEKKPKKIGRELTQAQAGGIIEASFGKFHFNAAGKMNFAGKDGFRQLNLPHYKHLVSTHA